MDSETLARKLFEHFGASVQKLPEGETKTPDFLVELGGQRYLVEVKGKEPSAEKEAERESVLIAGNVAEDHDTVGRKNVVSGVIKEAVDQLEAATSYQEDFKIAFLVGTGRLAELYFEQFESALYGTVPVADFGPNADDYHRPCYYFDRSDFFRFRKILDAAVIWCGDSGKLLVNDHSERYSEFLNSSLAACLSGGLVDPRQKEKSGSAYYADGDVDRTDAEVVIAYLRKKYGKPKLIHIPMGYHGASVLGNV